MCQIFADVLQLVADIICCPFRCLCGGRGYKNGYDTVPAVEPRFGGSSGIVI